MMQSEFLDALLSLLDEDREQAGLAYQKMHERLVRFFRLNNGSDPQALADETLDRLARRAADSMAENIGSLRAFSLGIARHVLQEDVRHRSREALSAQQWTDFTMAVDRDSEYLLDAIESCLARMTVEKRELLRSYYEWRAGNKISHHQQIAERLGLTMNALRNRIMRARNELDDCVRQYQRDITSGRSTSRRKGNL